MTEGWTSLAIVKLIVSILGPFSVVALGFFLNGWLKRLEQSQWANQKLIERRLQLFDDIAPSLNLLFVFYMWIGYWKEVSPKSVIDAKRYLDKTVHIYSHLLPDSFEGRYNELMNILFITYTGAGEDAKIRSLIHGPDGDRTKDGQYVWDSHLKRSSQNGTSAASTILFLATFEAHLP